MCACSLTLRPSQWRPLFDVGDSHDSLTPTFPSGPATAPLLPQHRDCLRPACRTLRTPFRPLAGATDRRAAPVLPRSSPAPTSRLLHRPQPYGLRPPCPLSRHPATPLPHAL